MTTPKKLIGFHICIYAVLCLLACCGCSGGGSSQSQIKNTIIVVTNLADGSGPGELRDAITTANAGSGTTITFRPGLSGTITLTSALPQITSNVTIQGPGATVIAVDGASKYRPFYVNAPGRTVTISGLTVQHGSNQADSANGGAINVMNGALTMANCSIVGNTATGASGGGVCDSATTTVTAGSIALTNCTLSGNSAGSGGGASSTLGPLTFTDCTIASNSAGLGGGIASGGTTTINGCTISENSAAGVGALGGSAAGGGIWALGTTEITGCTFTANTAVGNLADGGGIDGAYQVTISNSTFSGNSAGGSGGGISMDGGSITSCTLSDNSANYGGGIVNDYLMTITNSTLVGNRAISGGGGLCNSVDFTVLINCTLSGNSAANGGAVDNLDNVTLTNCITYGDSGGEVTNGTTAITYSDIDGGFTGTGNINTNPLLGPLADNGSQTETMALGSGSPCYGAGTPIGAPATDQRGVARPNPPSMGAYDQ